MSEAFLGIARSASGRFWRHRAGDERLGLAIAQRCELPEYLGRMLAARGQTLESAPLYLDPRLRDLLPDPSRLKDMDRAVARLCAAIAAGETIAIFGDYDVDGATSAALIARFLAAVGAKAPLLHVPDRQREGYGPNLPALIALQEQGAKIVVTVDCGITAFAPLAEAAALGLDIVIVDHHVAEPALPKAHAIVNPNRFDESREFGYLAAVGVAFLLIVALNRALRQAGWYGATRAEPDLKQWLDIVALGTVADVVPLTGLNRAFVAQGLKIMAGWRNPGLAALAEVAGIKERPGTYHAGFILGPRVNAGGRVGRSDLGLRLLAGDDPREAAALAKELDALNAERRAIEADVLAAAIAAIESAPQLHPYLVLVAGEGWHPGVIGIVASRLKERYQRPACVVALDRGLGKGSGRSVSGLHLGEAVIAAREAGILAKGGGHAMAAGFELAADRLGDFRAFLEERFARDLAGAPLVPILDIDAALQPGGATPELIDALDRLAPFGSGNPEPKFAIPSARLAFVDPVGEGHLRLSLEGADGRRLKAIAFRVLGASQDNALGRLLLESRGQSLHLAGQIRRDTWQGRNNVQLIVEDAAAIP